MTAGLPMVQVRVPGLLARFTGGERSVTVRAETVREGIVRLLEAHPDLEPHLLDGAGDLRPHLHLFHNGAAVGGLSDADLPVEAGDEIVLVQAVSGGSTDARFNSAGA